MNVPINEKKGVCNLCCKSAMGSFRTKYIGSAPPRQLDTSEAHPQEAGALDEGSSQLPQLAHTSRAHPQEAGALDEGSSQFPQLAHTSSAHPREAGALDEGSSQPPLTRSQESMLPPPVTVRGRRKKTKKKLPKMPSVAQAVPMDARPEAEKAIRQKWQDRIDAGHKDMEPLVEIFMARMGTTSSKYRVPSYIHSGSADPEFLRHGADHQATQEFMKSLSTWQENTRLRLEKYDTEFWRSQFKIYAPDLYREVQEKNLIMSEHVPELPPNFLGHPDNLCTDDIQNTRRLLLFQWSRDCKNLRSLPFSPEKDIVVIDGHMITVTSHD